MGQQKEALKKRDRYATLVAVERCAIMLRDWESNEPGHIILRVEDYDSGCLDDLVEIRVGSTGARTRTGWQVKRQETDLAAIHLESLLKTLCEQPDLEGVLALPTLVDVKRVGPLRILAQLCCDARAAGANLVQIAAHLGAAERSWLAFLNEITGQRDDIAALRLAARLEVRAIGYETDILGRAADRLAAVYGTLPASLLHTIETFLSGVAGNVDITAELLERDVLASLRASGALMTRSDLRNARATFLEGVSRAATRLRPLASLAHDPSPYGPDILLSDVYIDAAVGDLDEDRPHSDRLLDRAKKLGAKLAIVDDVGTGKTAALRHLAALLAREAQDDPSRPVPFLIHAKHLSIDLGRASEVFGGTSPAIAEKMLRRRQPFILMVDGLDEVGQATWDLIDDVQANYPTCAGIVAASRPFSPPSPRSRYQTLRIRTWSEVDVELFLGKWAALDPTAADAVRTALSRATIERSLLANPLTATLCLRVAAVDGVVPRTRTELFSRVCHLLFDEWRRTRSHPEAGYGWPELQEPLSTLALEYLRASSQPLPESRLHGILGRAIGTRQHAVAREAERELGVLVRGPHGFDFALRPIAEYLAGAALARLSDEEIEIHAQAPWALETVRHALGILATGGGLGRALDIIAGIARLALHTREFPVLTTRPLRPLLAAIRTVIDLGPTAAPSAQIMAEALTHVLRDESSSWVGDLVAEAVRPLAMAGGPCWEALLLLVLKVAASFNEEPAAWYEAQQERPLDFWLRAVFHRDPGVRATALRRLGEHIHEAYRAEVLGVLAVETKDEAYVYGGLPPAVHAALVIRSLPRDERFAPLRRQLLRMLGQRNQVTSGAAAIALRADEAPVTDLVAALRSASDAYHVPASVLAELAAHADGERVLNEAWPTWQEQRLAAEPWHHSPAGAADPPPASAAVRVRLLRACGPALADLPAEVLRTLTARSAYVREHAVVDALERSPGLAERLDLKNVPLDAQPLIGRAALLSPTFRLKLLATWRDPDVRDRATYPGIALEPMIEAGDDEAAAVYAEWLPSSLYMMIGPNSLDPPRPAAILHPLVRPNALALARSVASRVTCLDAEGRRLRPQAAGQVLNYLSDAWRSDPALLSDLAAWIGSDDDNKLTGALVALWPVQLGRGLRRRIVSKLRQRLTTLQGTPDSAEIAHHARTWLEWIDASDVGPGLLDLVYSLAQQNTYLGLTAGAVALPHIAPSDAQALSAQKASVGILADRHDLRDTLLRRYVQFNPDAWTDAATAAAAQDAVLDGASGLRALDYFSIEGRRRVCGALSGSGAAKAELPWIQQHDDYGTCVRPADIVRRIMFDLWMDGLASLA